MHCMGVSLGLDGAGLGSAGVTSWPRRCLLTPAFGDVTVHEIESDPINNYYIARK